MSLNLKQITDKLNGEFTGDTRKLVFWYDANAEFVEDIDNIELENAKVLRLLWDNQFYVKHLLECEDTSTNYLVYAPFAKPDIRNNHLADTIRYSKEFFADLASLVLIDLGIDNKYKSVIQHYIKFFSNKDRMQKFYDMQTETYNSAAIETAIMAVLCKCKTPSFEEVMRVVLTGGDIENNKYMAEFEKYGLINAFWHLANTAFGYGDTDPSLEKLIITMFVTYASSTINADLPAAWKPFISYKSGNIIAFIDSIMNSRLYADEFDELSETAYSALDGKSCLEKMNADVLVDCDVFAGIDNIIIDWLIKRLENEDIGAKLSGKNIPQICEQRRKMHFGNIYRSQYFIIENAYYIISQANYVPISGIKNLVKYYTQNAYKVDRAYRYFYYYIDRTEDTAPFEKLREITENIYTNEFLNKITANWNNEFTGGYAGIGRQLDFFQRYINNSKERTVVIISDALRYETAHTLYEKLTADEKCTASIAAMQGVLPSHTPLGMAALLPHKKIEYDEGYNVLVDGKACASTEQRQAILNEYKQNGKCIGFDAVKSMKKTDLRGVFTGQDIVYIYHDQIDARGDKAATENEVFTACEEATDEIYALIKRLASQANTTRFIVTADHGFIYKRDKIKENDKISGCATKQDKVCRRYLLSQKATAADGVCSAAISSILGGDDPRVITYPLASDIFKTSGGGQNYVHGGSSPQELLIPVIDVKVDRGKIETSRAEISLITPVTKITNLIAALDFIQAEPVSDVVKETTYRVYFAAEDGEKISNENIVIADKKDTDSLKRMFKLRFNFKNKKYDKTKKHYLVAFDEKNGVEVLRREVVMDIAFADDFGFF